MTNSGEAKEIALASASGSLAIDRKKMIIAELPIRPRNRCPSGRRVLSTQAAWIKARRVAVLPALVIPVRC